jgi:signal transduction histidine kinase
VVGTVWVVAHDETRRFDGEDVRLLGSVAKFASAAYGLLASLETSRRGDLNKDAFLTILAHELRGPLAPMSASLQIMRVADGDRDAIARARDVMERQVVEMARLVDDLLDVGRIRQDKIQLKIDRTEIATVVRNAVESSLPSFVARGHDLLLDLPAEPILVNADAARLAQVFSNLLTNAAKYTEPSGHIRLSVKRQGPEIVVAVKDDGLGISPLILPRVFDIFTQSEQSLEKSQGGLGVGLHIAKRLVELHGGSVEARSDGEGLGSEFVVTLPAATAAAGLRASQGAAELARI